MTNHGRKNKECVFFISSRNQYTFLPHTFCGKQNFCKDQWEKKFTFRRGMKKMLFHSLEKFVFSAVLSYFQYYFENFILLLKNAGFKILILLPRERKISYTTRK